MRKFTLKLTMVLIAIVAGFASCQDYHEDLYADLKKSVSICDTTYSQATVSLQNQIDSVAQVLKQDSLNLAGQIKQLDQNIADQMHVLDSIIDTLSSIIDTIPGCTVDTAEIFAKIRANKDSIVSLEEKLAAIGLLKQQIQDNSDSIDIMKGAIIAQTAALIALEKQIQNNKDSIDTLNVKIGEIATIKQQIADLQNDLQDTANYLIKSLIADYLRIADTASLVQKSKYQAEFQALMDSLAAHRDSIDKFSGFMDSIKVHRDSLDSYKKYIDSLFNRVNRLHSEINSKLITFIDAQITSIQIQQINSGVFMNFATPYGVSSNLLSVFWGTFKEEVDFPSLSGAVRGPAFLPGEIASSITIPDGTVITSSDSADNSGVVYLTLNPVENDFDGKTVSLVNSKGDAVMTSTLKATDDLLSFGYGWGTKAAIAGNGSQLLYKAPFQITEDNLDVFKADLLAPYKNIVKKIIETKKFDPTEVFWAAMNCLNEYGTAYAVKATYKDSIRNGKAVTDYQTIEKSVVSNFEIAAIAQKPLNFNAFEAIKTKTSQIRDIPFIPYEKIKNLFSKAISYELDIQFDNIDVDLPSFNLSIDESRVFPGDFTFNTLEATYEYPDPAGYYIAGTTIKHNGNMLTDKAEVTVASLANLEDSINAAVKRGIKKNLDYVADLLNTNTNNVIVNIEDSFNEELNTIINEINGKLDDIENIVKKVQRIAKKGQRVLNSTYAAKIVNFGNRVIEKMNNIKNDPAILCDPQLFYITDNNDVITLSERADIPTVFNGTGSLDLIMSSLTAEYLIPAYKKYITVIGMQGQCGDDFDTVLEGGQNIAVLENLTAGDYTIKYSFVDYAGNISTRVFYIRVI